MEDNLRLLIAAGKGLVIVDNVGKHSKLWNVMHLECLQWKNTVKVLNFGTPKMFAVINLKFNPISFSI